MKVPLLWKTWDVKSRKRNLEMITMGWLVFTLFRWQLLLTTGPGELMVWLDFVAVVYLPSSPVKPHLILSHSMRPGAVTKPMQSLSE